jgi:hypothetical protein
MKASARDSIAAVTQFSAAGSREESARKSEATDPARRQHHLIDGGTSAEVRRFC